MEHEGENKDLEEYKELGQEYRYRDQMMIQEFSLSMVAIGVVVNRLLGIETTTRGFLVVQVITALFIGILAFHLTHINQDRREALKQREQLREKLKFRKYHLGVSNMRPSAPRTMVWFSYVLVVTWLIWIGISISDFLGKT